MGTPLDLDTLGNNAVHSLGVSVKAKGAFVESFAKSAVAAGVARRPADGVASPLVVYERSELVAGSPLLDRASETATAGR